MTLLYIFQFKIYYGLRENPNSFGVFTSGLLKPKSLLKSNLKQPKPKAYALYPNKMLMPNVQIKSLKPNSHFKVHGPTLYKPKPK